MPTGVKPPRKYFLFNVKQKTQFSTDNAKPIFLPAQFTLHDCLCPVRQKVQTKHRAALLRTADANLSETLRAAIGIEAMHLEVS